MRTNGSVFFLCSKMSTHACVLAHFLDLEKVVASNAYDSDEQTGEVYRSQRVFEDEIRGGDRDDFLENTAYAERNDAGPFEKSEFGGRHEKR